MLAEGEVCGTRETVPYVLGTFQTISPKLALRWLRSEAERIADRLYPDPERSAWVMPWMRLDTVPVPDCSAELRFWAEDPEEHQAARDQLKEGAPLSVVIPDSGCRYILTVWPVAVPSPESSATLPADDGQPTSPRPRHTSHRKPRRTSGWLVPFL
ncbi:hypothetical protein [Streptomyces sp. NRRL S-920]|uniref:hypothetical protein n=1 Tax=Streptomyces sp. NRRL S-920 TaxID=1463921 RepID=UPI001F1FA65E|nr:hypothetical protein [Streptomyces sp. NRRL S-920]